MINRVNVGNFGKVFLPLLGVGIVGSAAGCKCHEFLQLNKERTKKLFDFSGSMTVGSPTEAIEKSLQNKYEFKVLDVIPIIPQELKAKKNFQKKINLP